MAFAKYLRKLMGWCPMKDPLRKGRQEDFFSAFKSENGNLQLGSSPAGLQESRTLKARVNPVGDLWGVIIILIIGFFAVIASLLLYLYSPEGSFLIIFSGLIMFLTPLMLLLYRPNTVALISGKITIKVALAHPAASNGVCSRHRSHYNGNYSKS